MSFFSGSGIHLDDKIERKMLQRESFFLGLIILRFIFVLFFISTLTKIDRDGMGKSKIHFTIFSKHPRFSVGSPFNGWFSVNGDNVRKLIFLSSHELISITKIVNSSLCAVCLNCYVACRTIINIRSWIIPAFCALKGITLPYHMFCRWSTSW